MQYETITKKNIRRMVDHFYSQILKDELISEFFIEKLGDEMISDEWLTHMNLLTDFWASLILGDTNYHGKPIKPHMHMEGLTRESFERWLKLFFETVDRLYVKEASDSFKTHGEKIANNFMLVLNL